MDDKKDINEPSEVKSKPESKVKTMQELASKFDKPIPSEPNLFYYILFMTILYLVLFWLCAPWVDRYGMVLLVYVPSVGSFLSVLTFRSGKESNPFELFFLAVLPGMIMFLVNMQFVSWHLGTILLIPFIFPLFYLTGILGNVMGFVIYNCK